MMLGLERCHAQLTDPGCAYKLKNVEISVAVSKPCHAHRSMTGGWSRHQRRRSRRWSSGSTRQCRVCKPASAGGRPWQDRQPASALVAGGRRPSSSVCCDWTLGSKCTTFPTVCGATGSLGWLAGTASNVVSCQHCCSGMTASERHACVL